MCACVSTAAPVAARAQAQPANWLETRIAIEDLAAAGAYVGALALGPRLLELAAAEPDDSGFRVAEAHLLLASIHRANGDYSAAENEILAAIDVYEAEVGRLSPALIEPFLALGDNYEEAGDLAAAVSAWGEARTIGRRNYGLLNEHQLPSIDKMTAAAEELDQIEAARDLQQEALVLIERVNGPGSLESMEARFKYAEWLRKHEYFGEELRLYFEIQRTIAEHHGNDPIMIARVLRRRAESFRISDNDDPLGLGGLRDALELVENMPDPPPLLMAGILVDIGDWYVEFGRGSGAEYLRAWELLGQLENSDELRYEWFTNLNEIELTPISRKYLSDDPDDPAGYVIIEFTVDTGGQTRNIAITDSRPAGLKDAAALASFRTARFRPRIANGVLVAAPRIYRLDFRYQPSAEESGRD